MSAFKDREFIIVTWPECQELFDKLGFQENCCLIDSYKFMEEYGSSAYFVDKEWYNKNTEFIIDEHTEEQLLADEVRIKTSLDIARKAAKESAKQQS